MVDLTKKQIREIEEAISHFNDKVLSFSRSSKYADVVLPEYESLEKIQERVISKKDIFNTLQYLKSIDDSEIVEIGNIKALNTFAVQKANETNLLNDVSSFMNQSSKVPRTNFNSKSDFRRYVANVLLDDSDFGQMQKTALFKKELLNSLMAIASRDENVKSLFERITNLPLINVHYMWKNHPDLFYRIEEWYSYDDTQFSRLVDDVNEAVDEVC